MSRVKWNRRERNGENREGRRSEGEEDNSGEEDSEATDVHETVVALSFPLHIELIHMHVFGAGSRTKAIPHQPNREA